MSKNRTYITIDLKSFFASVECVERNLDPLNTNLVVADDNKTEKTICLAVSPSLKSLGVGSRPRLFEVIQTVKNINRKRLKIAKNFEGKSYIYNELMQNKKLELDYIISPPRMSHYIEYSNRIYKVYLKYISSEDIHIYSIDEVFIDVTSYLKIYGKNAKELASTIIKDVLKETGITATAGIGTNMYLAKIAMDIVAKKMPVYEDGMRIAELDEISYRKLLWNHTPITDFWRVGSGYAKKLEKIGIYTMGDVARCSIEKNNSKCSQELLFKIFGKNAELLIDHAWGYEPCTMEVVKNYKPERKSLGSGQVLQEPYTNDKAKLVIWEMVDMLVLDIVSKKLLTNQIVLHISYDIENLTNPDIKKLYNDEITIDIYGRKVPKLVRGTINLKEYSSSTREILDATIELYDRITNPILLIRKINVTFNNIIKEENKMFRQISIFDMDINLNEENKKEKNLQKAILKIKNKFGKNAVLKGKNLEEGATAKNRNKQIGGHRE